MVCSSERAQRPLLIAGAAARLPERRSVRELVLAAQHERLLQHERLVARAIQPVLRHAPRVQCMRSLPAAVSRRPSRRECSRRESTRRWPLLRQPPPPPFDAALRRSRRSQRTQCRCPRAVKAAARIRSRHSSRAVWRLRRLLRRSSRSPSGSHSYLTLSRRAHQCSSRGSHQQRRTAARSPTLSHATE